MKEMQFVVDIYAPKERVWETLWQDETFRSWAGIIDPGTFMTGELKQGGEVQFISSENGYGVTSLVEKVVPHEYLLLRHQADTQDAGERERAQEWTGGTESYALAEKDGVTTLTFICDVPLEMEEYFTETYPKALARIRELAEQSAQLT